ncbi:MAG TPA: response regulator [Microlunatus sp.]|nr:response regulator [Microlunatus sp.]
MSAPRTFTALVVEDEAVVAEANALYLARLGLTVTGVVHSGREALRELAGHPEIDLVLLDMNLPDGHGLELLRRIRAAGHAADVIAVTAARDVDVVRQAVAHGVVAYVIKPFTFASFRSKVEQYLTYREQLEGQQAALGQSEVDAMLATLRPALSSQNLPKGLSVDMLGRVSTVLRAAGSPTASDVADQLGTSRVTARRYLEYLADTAMAERRTSHEGRSGRPEVRYRWR